MRHPTALQVVRSFAGLAALLVVAGCPSGPFGSRPELRSLADGGEGRDEVSIAFDVRDGDRSSVSIRVQYDTGAGFQDATLASAAPGVAGTGVIGGLRPAGAWVPCTAAWDTNADGVGASGVETVTLCITPLDDDGDGQPVEISFDVDNFVPNLVVAESSVVFGSAFELVQNAPDEQIHITNGGAAGTTLNWTTSVAYDTGGTGWLTLTPASDSCTTETDTVTLSADAVGQSLAVGTHTATITVADPVARFSPVQIPVTLAVYPPGADILVHDGADVPATSLTFATQLGQAAVPSQSVFVKNAGPAGSVLLWSASDDVAAPDWLAYAPSSDNAASGDSDEVVVDVDLTGLPAGTYIGTITVTGTDQAQSIPAASGDKTVAVTLVVDPAPVLAATPNPLTFTGAIQGLSNPTPGSLDAMLSCTLNGSTWNATIPGGETWLSVSPLSGTLAVDGNQAVGITVDAVAGGLSAGTHTATVRFTDATSPAAYVDLAVEVVVDPRATIVAVPGSFTFTANEGASDPGTQTLAISNTGAADLNWSISDDATWLALSPTSDSCTTETNDVTLTVTLGALTEGSYSASITITDPNASNDPVTVSVTFTVYGEEIWVGKDGDDTTGDGSYGSPYLTISHAMSVVTAGGKVGVKPGVYEEKINVPANVALESEAGARVTSIDGSDLGSIFSAVDFSSFSKTCSLRGFTITGWVRAVRANTGGIVRDCVIEGNEGGLLFWSASGSLIVGNVFSGCEIDGTDSAIRLESSAGDDIFIANNAFYDNGGDGHVVKLDVGSGSVASVYFENNTVAYNDAGGVRLAGSAAGSYHLGNNIIAFNDQEGVAGEGGIPVMSNNDIYGHDTDYALIADQSGSNGNISVDPSLAAMTDLRLRAGSPCIDAGSNTGNMEATDLRGAARVAGAAVDIGCYEFDATLDVLSVSPATLSYVAHFQQSPDSQTFAILNIADAAVDWTLADDATWLSASLSSGPLVVGASTEVTLSVDVAGLAEGTYAATVTISDQYGVWQALEVPVSLTVFSTIYVDPAGDDLGLGTSADPFQTIGHATSVCGDDAMIVVRAGTYNEDIVVVDDGVHIRGESGAAATVLHGSGAYNLEAIDLEYVDRFTLEGMTVENGFAAIEFHGGTKDLVVRDCVFDSCVHQAMYLYSVEGFEITNCVFSNNAYSGSAGYMPSALSIGGSVTRGREVVANCLFVDNEDDGVYVSGGADNDLVFVNNTVVGTQSRGVVLGYWSPRTLFANNIVVGNGTGIEHDGNSPAQLITCDIWNNGEDFVGLDSPVGIEGTIAADPQFIDAAGGDYRIRASSPCRDVGFGGTLPRDVDVRGAPRVDGAAVDMGCYEWLEADSPLDCGPYTVVFDNAVTGLYDPRPASQSVAVLNHAGASIDWTAQVTGGGSWLAVVPGVGTVGAGASEDVAFTVSSVSAALGAGDYVATVRFVDDADATSFVDVEVSLHVDAQLGILASPAAFEFQATDGMGNPADQTLSISNTIPGGLSWTATDDASWLTLAPTGDTCTTETDTITLSVDVSGLAVGRHDATVTIDDPVATNAPLAVRVTLHVTEDAVWVATDGSDLTGDGSYASPVATLVRGAELVPPGGSIIIKPGAYRGNTVLEDDDVTIRGLTTAAECVIRGTYTNNVAAVDLDGHANATFRDVTISRGFRAVDVSGAAGLTVTQCIIKENSHTAFENLQLGATITRNVFEGGNYSGSATYMPSWIKVTFNGSGPILIADNLFLGCQDDGILITGVAVPSNASIVNNTFMASTRSCIWYSAGSSDMAFANNIITGCYVGCEFTATAVIGEWFNNDVYGNTTDWSDVARDQTGVNGNIAEDPGFLSAPAGDYRIGSASLCRDAGSNAHVVTTVDYRGQPRVSGSFVDIGCYEFIAGTDDKAAIHVTPAAVHIPGFVGAASLDPVELVIGNTGETTLNWQLAESASWLTLDQTSGSCDAEGDLVLLTASAAGLTAGTYTVDLVVSDAAAYNSPCVVPVTFDLQDAVWLGPSGSDVTGDGTPGAPFRSLVPALTAVPEGGWIILTPGTYTGDVIFTEEDHPGVFITGTGDPSLTVYEGCISSFSAPGLTISDITFGNTDRGLSISGNVEPCFVEDCVFEGMTTEAIYCGSGNVVVSRCEIDGCLRGCRSLNSATVEFRDCLFTDCTHGMYLSVDADASITVVNCTIDSCTTGVYFRAPGAHHFSNCIITNNDVGIQHATYDDPIVEYCDVWNNTTANYADMTDPTGSAGNISVDPAFVNAGSGDYRIASTSPCREAGDNTSVTSTIDLRAEPRIIDGDIDLTATVDMGCYEWQTTDP